MHLRLLSRAAIRRVRHLPVLLGIVGVLLAGCSGNKDAMHYEIDCSPADRSTISVATWFPSRGRIAQ